MTDPRAAFDLTGRVAIVTGAGSGIGAASARMLGAAGATVVCADVNPDGARATAKAIESSLAGVTLVCTFHTLPSVVFAT